MSIVRTLVFWLLSLICIPVLASVDSAEQLSRDCRHTVEVFDSETPPPGWDAAAADRCQTYVAGALEMLAVVKRVEVAPGRHVCFDTQNFEPRPLIAKIVALGVERHDVFAGKRPIVLLMLALYAMYPCNGEQPQ